MNGFISEKTVGTAGFFPDVPAGKCIHNIPFPQPSAEQLTY
jgi:hypothetical protein